MGLVILFLIIFFGAPVMSLGWFIFDLVLFLKCPKEDKEKRRKCRIQLILAAILAFIFVGGVTLLLYMLSQATWHM